MNSANKFQNFWSRKINYINNLQINYKLEKTSFSKFENIEFYNLLIKSPSISAVVKEIVSEGHKS